MFIITTTSVQYIIYIFSILHFIDVENISGYFIRFLNNMVEAFNRYWQVFLLLWHQILFVFESIVLHPLLAFIPLVHDSVFDDLEQREFVVGQLIEPLGLDLLFSRVAGLLETPDQLIFKRVIEVLQTRVDRELFVLEHGLQVVGADESVMITVKDLEVDVLNLSLLVCLLPVLLHDEVQQLHPLSELDGSVIALVDGLEQTLC